MLRLLFGVHAMLTLAAGIVLIAAPGAIPATVGIPVEPPAYLLCYLLAAAELAMAALSWGAITLTDLKALRVIVLALIVFHAMSALLEFYAVTGGASSAVLGNAALRVIVVALFAYYGFKTPGAPSNA